MVARTTISPDACGTILPLMMVAFPDTSDHEIVLFVALDGATVPLNVDSCPTIACVGAKLVMSVTDINDMVVNKG